MSPQKSENVTQGLKQTLSSEADISGECTVSHSWKGVDEQSKTVDFQIYCSFGNEFVDRTYQDLVDDSVNGLLAYGEAPESEFPINVEFPLVSEKPLPLEILDKSIDKKISDVHDAITTNKKKLEDIEQENRSIQHSEYETRRHISNHNAVLCRTLLSSHLPQMVSQVTETVRKRQDESFEEAIRPYMDLREKWGLQYGASLDDNQESRLYPWYEKWLSHHRDLYKARSTLASEALSTKDYTRKGKGCKTPGVSEDAKMAKQIAVSGLASVKRKVSKSAQKRLGSFAFPQNCKGWQDLKELEDQQPQHSAQTTVATKSKGKGTPAAHTKSAEGKDAFIKSEGTSVSGLQSSELDNKTSPTTRLLTHQHAMATSSQSNSRKKGDTGFRMDAGIVDHANKYLYTKDGASMSDSKGTKTYYRTPFSDPAVKFKSAGYPSGSTNSPDPQQFSADEAPGEDWTVVPQKTRSKAKPAKPRQRTYQGTARWKNKWTKPAPPPADKVASSHASTAPRGKQQVWNSSVTGQAARGHPESQSAHTLVEHKSDNPATARSVIETTSKSQSEHDRSEAQDSDTTTRASNAPSGLKVAGAAERDMMQGPENLPTALSSCAPESICGDDGEDVKNSVVSSQVAESTFESQLAPVETQTELRDADPRHPAHEILAAQQSGYAPGDIPLHPGATAWYPHPGYEGGQSQSFNNPDYYTPFQPFPNHAQHYHDSYEIHATDATGWSPYSFHPPGFMNFTTPHQGYYTHTAGYYPPSHGPMYSGPGPQPDLSYYPSGPMVNDHSNALLNDNNTENMSQYHSHESYRPIEEHDSYVEPPAEAIVEENKDELEQSISDDDISSDEGSKWMKRRRSI